jgi:hypothetical protein
MFDFVRHGLLPGFTMEDPAAAGLSPELRPAKWDSSCRRQRDHGS